MSIIFCALQVERLNDCDEEIMEAQLPPHHSPRLLQHDNHFA